MHHLAHLLFFLTSFPAFGLLEGEPPTEPPAEPAAPVEPGEPKTSYERAQDYVKEHPLFGDEKAPEPVKPGEAEKPAEPPKEPEKPAEPVKPGEAEKPAEPPKPGEFVYDATKPVEKLEDFEKLPFFKDATFQKIVGEHKEQALQLNGLRDVFGGNWREVGTKFKVESTDQLKAVLEDAYSLYDIGNLASPVTEFMAIFEKNFPEGNVKAVLAQLAAYIEGKGIKAADAANLNDPNAVRLTRLENERKTDRENKLRETDEMQRKVAFEGLEKHVTDFVKANDADVADAMDYLTVIISQIGGKKEYLDQIRAGKFAEITRMLTEYHNKQVERQKRWMDTKLKSAEEREKKLPTKVTPNQGGPPAPVAPAKPKVNYLDGEERRKEALRQFREPAQE